MSAIFKIICKKLLKLRNNKRGSNLWFQVAGIYIKIPRLMKIILTVLFLKAFISLSFSLQNFALESGQILFLPDIIHQISQSAIACIYIFLYVHTEETRRSHKSSVMTECNCSAAQSPAEVALCKHTGDSHTMRSWQQTALL